jgi:hypothetical protein
MTASLSISGSTYRTFLSDLQFVYFEDPRRLGQLAYEWFKLEKFQSPETKEWADKLYELSGKEATKFIEAQVDWSN